MAHYELVEHHQTTDDGFVVPGSQFWKVTKDGIELPISFTTKSEALEALNGYTNQVQTPDY